MEHFNNAVDFYGSLYGLIGAVYMTVHILLPFQMVHPLKVTISCQEGDCDWTAKGRDRGRFFTNWVLNRLKAKHKAHFLKAHPDQEWIYG